MHIFILFHFISLGFVINAAVTYNILLNLCGTEFTACFKMNAKH